MPREATQPFANARIGTPIAFNSVRIGAYETCSAAVNVSHPVDRREPRVTIQDLRRDLRQADEERFLLTMSGSDPRHSWIGVQDVRRHLREADEERFRLTMQVRSQATLIKRGSITILLLAIAGSGIAFRNAEQRLPAPSGLKAAMPVTPAPASVVLGERPSEIPPPPLTVTTRKSSPKPVTQPPRSATRAHNRPIQEEGPEPEPPRRVAPRPLHPGEFGRKSAVPSPAKAAAAAEL